MYIIVDDVYKEWLLLRYRYVKASPDVKSFLCELKSLYRLALITNGSSTAQWEKINACGLEQYFDCIVVSGDTPWKKPDVEIFYKVGFFAFTILDKLVILMRGAYKADSPPDLGMFGKIWFWF